MTSGILIIDKEKNMTSRDVVNICNKKFGIKKIGHTGTLDPLATGVLVLCINDGTKLVEILTQNDKEYVAEITFGIMTDTLDITGKIIKEEIPRNITEEEFDFVLKSFLGKSIQEVPKTSAVKVNGKRLYKHSDDVVLPKREIKIYDIERISSIKNNKVSFKVSVSKGTYIRSLIRDISNKLNVLMTMSNLRRVKQGIFSIEDSKILDDVTLSDLISIEEVFKNVEKYELMDKMYQKVKNGVILDKVNDNEYTYFYYKNKLIGIYKIYDKDSNKIKPYRMFNVGDDFS